MNVTKYTLRGLAFYKKKHLTVLLATILSTAILTGALIVGDSVKYSLQKIVNQRLGKSGFALTSGDRMVSVDLVNNLGKNLNVLTAGVIETNGVAINQNKNLNLTGTSVYGVDSAFWKLADNASLSLENNETFISRNIAERLNVDTGEYILVRVHIPQTVSLNTPFSQDENTTASVRLKVKALLSDNEFGRFSLKSDQKSPFNIFISRQFLENELQMPGKVNQILVESKKGIGTKFLNDALKENWKLDDMGFKVEQVKPNEFRFSSDKIFINDIIASEIVNYSNAVNPAFTYLINYIKTAKNNTPYSFVAGINAGLKNNQVIINEWLANDLNVGVGDTIKLSYFLFGEFRDLIEDESAFIVAGIKPNNGDLFNKALMPDFPGLADAGSCNEWEAGVPVDLDKIRQKDEDYWDEFKGTPKAIISYKKATEIWNNSYGLHTSFFISGDIKKQEDFRNYLLQNISPHMVGLNFNSVKSEGVRAAGNGVDFGELFLSLSFFVIVAAVLLMSLIYKINIDTRLSEIATLSALGLKNKLISKLILFESTITIIIGGVIGAFIGIMYNQLLISSLNTIWQQAVYTSSLHAYVSFKSVSIGFLSGVIMAFFTLYTIIKKFFKKGINSQLKANFVQSNKGIKRSKIAIIILAVLLILGLVYGLALSQLSPAIALSLGGVVLIISILGFRVLLYAWNNKNINKIAVFQVVLKNLSHTPKKNLILVSMLAIGVYSVLITGANRKTFNYSQEINSSGTGGYDFWAESTLPIIYNLNSDTGKEYLGLVDEPAMDSTRILTMQKLHGNDASCLNLNQVQQPSILGVNVEQLNNKKAFSFAKLLPEVNTENPWLFLESNIDENTYPVYLDQTVITWGIMKKVGDTLQVLSETGDSVNLIIAGGLDASVFQGHMLIDQQVFKKLFPSQGGANVFLINCPPNKTLEVQELLEYLLGDFGFSMQATNKRLAQFYSVTNTYLNVFILLGGLALIIGTLGLGIVILRNLLDRKKEFALMQGIGLKQNKIIQIVIIEYSLLLGVGIFIGTLAAFIGMVPSLISEAFSVPWIFLLKILIAIIANSFLWIYLPTHITLKGNLTSALKSE